MLEQFSLLYVEDDICMQEYMKELLEDEVEEFYQAFNGKEAIEIYKEKKPHIILSDINMPIMNGFDMTKEIKQIDQEQVIIFVTALTEIEDVKKAIDLHVNGFINKPITDLDEFFSYIESKTNVLKIKKLQKELEKTKIEKEKLNFIIETIKQITHHWRQPLNTISISASSLSYKKEHDLKMTDEDFEYTDVIIKQVDKLSLVLKQIEMISEKKDTDIKTLTELIKISDPIYE